LKLGGGNFMAKKSDWILLKISIALEGKGKPKFPPSRPSKKRQKYQKKKQQKILRSKNRC
jgi:hypothetical protein